MKKYMLSLLISAVICYTNASEANKNKCNKLLTDQSSICTDLKYLKNDKIWEESDCTNYLRKNLLLTPDDLQKKLKENAPESFKQAVKGKETGKSYGSTCAERRYDQYKSDYDFYEAFTKGYTVLPSGALLAIEGDSDDEQTKELENKFKKRQIDNCTALLMDLFIKPSNLSLDDCGIETLLKNPEWESNGCTKHFINNEFTHGKEHYLHLSGDDLRCRNKIDEIKNSLKQQNSKK